MRNWLRYSGMLDEVYVKKAKKEPVVLPPRIDQLVRDAEATPPPTEAGESGSGDNGIVAPANPLTASQPQSPGAIHGATVSLLDTSARSRTQLWKEQQSWYRKQMRLPVPPREVHFSDVDEVGEEAEDEAALAHNAVSVRHRPLFTTPSGHAVRRLPATLKRDAVAGLLGSSNGVSTASSRARHPRVVERLCTMGVTLADYLQGVLELRVLTYQKQMTVPPTGAVVLTPSPAPETDAAEDVYGTPTPYLPNPSNSQSECDTREQPAAVTTPGDSESVSVAKSTCEPSTTASTSTVTSPEECCAADGCASCCSRCCLSDDNSGTDTDTSENSSCSRASTTKQTWSTDPNLIHAATMIYDSCLGGSPCAGRKGIDAKGACKCIACGGAGSCGQDDNMRAQRSATLCW